jgi:hypothetical protein
MQMIATVAGPSSTGTFEKVAQFFAKIALTKAKEKLD